MREDIRWEVGRAHASSCRRFFRAARSAGSESLLCWAAFWGDSLLWPCFALHCVACSSSEAKRRYVVSHPWLPKEHPDPRGEKLQLLVCQLDVLLDVQLLVVQRNPA